MLRNGDAIPVELHGEERFVLRRKISCQRRFALLRKICFSDRRDRLWSGFVSVAFAVEAAGAAGLWRLDTRWSNVRPHGRAVCLPWMREAEREKRRIAMKSP